MSKKNVKKAKPNKMKNDYVEQHETHYETGEYIPGNDTTVFSTLDVCTTLPESYGLTVANGIRTPEDECLGMCGTLDVPFFTVPEQVKQQGTVATGTVLQPKRNSQDAILIADYYGNQCTPIEKLFKRNIKKGKKTRKKVAKELHKAYPTVFGKNTGKTKSPYVYVAHAIVGRDTPVPVDDIKDLIMVMDSKTNLLDKNVTFIDPELIEKGWSDKVIVPLDSSLVAEAQAVVLYLGEASMGAQYEIMLAKHLGIPLYVVQNTQHGVSAFVKHLKA